MAVFYMRWGKVFECRVCFAAGSEFIICLLKKLAEFNNRRNFAGYV